MGLACGVGETKNLVDIDRGLFFLRRTNAFVVVLRGTSARSALCEVMNPIAHLR